MEDAQQPSAPDAASAPPREPLGSLFLRFLKFGLLAWGGPVAQIAMIREELVERGRWITAERFNRVLAIYQALPGPEAHELCVYFGTLARGRLGGVLAGLGFMLPGFLLMFGLSAIYASHGMDSPLIVAAFHGLQAAVVALVVRALIRIGGHALTDRWLWLIAGLAGAAHLLGVNFLLSLALAGTAYAVLKRSGSLASSSLGSFLPLLLLPAAALALPPIADLFLCGLRSGLLTFGGAYTVIPFLQHDAVVRGAWMTNDQFLDGLALSSMLPAPLVIFATFVGYVGGGPMGSLALTAGIFLPAFSFTLIGHSYFERLVTNRSTHAFLDGVTAGVIGLMAATSLLLMREGLAGLPSIAIFLTALLVLYRWKSKLAVPVVVLGAGLVGLPFFLA